ncbi:MAG: hypothetical protein JWN04_2879 [Myxococcaceae bacterium]|nr:hypothetical protein [Myxococcaceae bacterium]
MDVRSRTYLSLTLVLSLAGACGDDSTTSDPPDSNPAKSSNRDSGTGSDHEVSDTPPKDASVKHEDPGHDAAVPTQPGSDAQVLKADGGSGAAADSGMPGPVGTGACCSDGDCLCHGDAPTELTSAAGSYKTAQLTLPLGTVYYPTDAEPPFAALTLCGGFTNTGPEMAAWGPLYASHGIVLMITTTGAADDPATRGMKLLAALTQLKAENTKSGSVLFGKLSGRYGTSGYSMGGGGTTLASAQDATLRTSIGLAPWGGSGMGVKVATLLLCGSSDTTAPCNMAQSVYDAIAGDTPKMLMSVAGATHFSWFGPTDAGMGTSGKYALAFQKVYLEGDERWKPLLLSKPSNATATTNIK